MGNQGTLIREAREKKGMSQETLADVCLISLADLKAFEDGEIELGEGATRFLCNVLDISAPALLEGRIEPRITPETLNALADKMEQVTAQLRQESSWLQMGKSHPEQPEAAIQGPTM